MKHSEIINEFRSSTAKVKANNANRKGYVTLSMTRISKEIPNFSLKERDTSHLHVVRVSPTVIVRRRFVPPTC